MLGAVRASTVNRPTQRGEMSPLEGRAFEVEQHLIARCEAHVPSAGVEARLQCVLPFLQQSASLCGYAAHQEHHCLTTPLFWHYLRLGGRAGDVGAGRGPQRMG